MVSNIGLDVDREVVTLRWDAAPSNGADVTYTVTLLQVGQQVYSAMTQSTTLDVSRDEFQSPEDSRMNTPYEVRVQAMNVAGPGEDVSATLFVESGTMTTVFVQIFTHMYSCGLNNNYTSRSSRNSAEHSSEH